MEGEKMTTAMRYSVYATQGYPKMQVEKTTHFTSEASAKKLVAKLKRTYKFKHNRWEKSEYIQHTHGQPEVVHRNVVWSNFAYNIYFWKSNSEEDEK